MYKIIGPCCMLKVINFTNIYLYSIFSFRAYSISHSIFHSMFFIALFALEKSNESKERNYLFFFKKNIFCNVQSEQRTWECH